MEIRDSDTDADTLTDDLLGFGYTNGNGEFSIDGLGGDGGDYSWSRPDVYVRIVLSDEDGPQGVRLTDELNSARSFATPQHDHDNVEGDIDIGAWSWGTQSNGSADNASACGIWLKSRDAFTNYISIPLVNPQRPPAGHYDIEYWSAVWAGEAGRPTPWTNLDTTHWPRHYHTGPVNEHEFAHSVRHTLDGDGAHFAFDVVRFWYAQHHSPCSNIDHPSEAYAFNEGWAEYWAGTVTGACGSGAPNYADEGDVAAALGVLEKRPGVGRARMVRVLQLHPGAIHSFAEFCSALDQLVAGACAGMASPLQGAARREAAGLSRAAHIEWIRGELAAQQVEARRVSAALQAARVKAAATRPTCRAQDCEAAFKTLAAPALLAGDLEIRGLAIRRLNSQLVQTKPSEGPRDRAREAAAYQQAKQVYLRQVRATATRAIGSALKAVSPLAKAAPAGAEMVELLQRQARRLGDPADRSLALVGVTPAVLTDETQARLKR